MHKSRYVVMNHENGWQIRNANCHVAATFPTKAQALRPGPPGRYSARRLRLVVFAGAPLSWRLRAKSRPSCGDFNSSAGQRIGNTGSTHNPRPSSSSPTGIENRNQAETGTTASTHKIRQKNVEAVVRPVWGRRHKTGASRERVRCCPSWERFGRSLLRWHSDFRRC